MQTCTIGLVNYSPSKLHLCIPTKATIDNTMMQDEYVKRINMVLRYIDEHLDEDLSLQVISSVAFYSPFHVHRLFKAITGETLNNYITRKRVERSALLLMHNPEYSIREIAMKYGFQNDTTYSRTFRKIYHQSPSAFRKSNLHNFSKIGKVNSNNGKADYITAEYLRNIDHLKKWITMNATIEITEMPDMHFAYATQIGVDGIENTFGRMVNWALQRGLLHQPNTSVCRVFHDSFKVTDADKVRMSIGILSEKQIVAEAPVEITTIGKGSVMKGRFVITPAEFEKSWDSMFIQMNAMGYKKAERNPYEIYHNNYNEHPEKKCIVDLIIPIEPSK